MFSFQGLHIRKRFEGVVALKDASISIDGNRICGLVGANGSGKDARDIGIVLAHQNLSLIPDLTVWQNIQLGHEKRTGSVFRDDRAAKETVENILQELVPGEISLDRKISALSPAHMQMVEIAKALSINSEVLIMDEPTSALTESEIDELFAVIHTLRDRGVSII